MPLKHTIEIDDLEFQIHFAWSPEGKHSADIDSSPYGNVLFDGVKCNYLGLFRVEDVGIGWVKKVNDLHLANTPGGRDAYEAKDFIKVYGVDREKIAEAWHKSLREAEKQWTDKLFGALMELVEDEGFMRQAELVYRRWLVVSLRSQRLNAEELISRIDETLPKIEAHIVALENTP